MMAVCWRKQRFQLTAARRRLAPRPTPAPPHHDFNSQPREGGWLAAMSFFSCPPPHFNSQPREGGWRGKNPAHQPAEYFNSQPREGGWLDNFINTPMRGAISTHSRAKAAGLSYALLGGAADISTHSRAKAAGAHERLENIGEEISTHSRAKAAGAAAETLNPQGLHRPVSLRFHRRHMTLLYHSQVRPIFPNC